MSFGKCPTTGEKCEFYSEWCTNSLDGSLPHNTLQIAAMVTRQAGVSPCGEIYFDEEGPIDPTCAAIEAAMLLAFESGETPG